MTEVERVRRLAEEISSRWCPDAYTIGRIRGYVFGAGSAEQKLAGIAEVLEAHSAALQLERAGDKAATAATEAPMTGAEALDAAAAHSTEAFANTLNGVLGAIEDAARRDREREHQQQCGTCGTWTDWVSSHGLCDACLSQRGAAR